MNLHIVKVEWDVGTTDLFVVVGDDPVKQLKEQYGSIEFRAHVSEAITPADGPGVYPVGSLQSVKWEELPVHTGV